MSDNQPMIFAVLDDGETFGAAHGSQILIGPGKLKASDEDDLENGELPDAWFDGKTTRPAISFAFSDNGDLVARYHGFPGNRDNTSIVLVDADLLGRLA